MVLGAGDMIQAKQAKKRSLGAEKESGLVQGAPNKREKQWYEDLPLGGFVGATSKNTKQQTDSSARAASSAMDAQGGRRPVATDVESFHVPGCS